MRFLRRDHFACENHLHGDALTHEPWQSLCSAVTGNNPQLHFRLPQLGIFTGEADRTRQGDFAASAESESVEASDDGLPQILNEIEHALAAMRVLLAGDGVLLGQFGNVSARDEGFFTRTGEDDNAD